MEDNYIMLNGKMVPLTEEQVAALLGGKETEREKVDPFDRNLDQIYYYIDYLGELDADVDNFSEDDDNTYNAANYCTDKEMMNQRAMHETLNRLLWRYSEQHGGDNEWDGENLHYSITINDVLVPGSEWFASVRPFGTVYFKDRDTAQAAIDDVVRPFLAEHPDFVW